ncbi:hypothetical protein Patl1_24801 [Pistacia atlantica]|uniref:Uncharacterized protein n=1 Tax=Pistacia atlantica TaxID=434234 RepID=A0ACC1B0L5_9ROSI|nr:hypothetical protein Patl1_24801 [Pistacia atlantica]
MLNIFSLIYICFNSTLYSSSLLFTKLPEAYTFFLIQLYMLCQ